MQVSLSSYFIQQEMQSLKDQIQQDQAYHEKQKAQREEMDPSLNNS